MRSTRSGATALGLGAAFFVFTVISALEMHGGRGLVHDDPYIFYRYARNLTDGQGWAYNPGASSAGGATSPLYVLVLAALYKLGIPMTSAATATFAVGLALAGTGLFAALSRIGRPLGGVVAGALLVSSPVIVQTRGMETALVIGLLALSTWMFVSRWPVASGTALALLCLARPDEATFAIAFLATQLVWDRRDALRMAIPLLAIGIAWTVYAEVAIGQVIPDTLKAKVDQGKSGYFGTGPLFLKGFWYLLDSYGITAAVAILYMLGGGGVILLAWLAARRFGTRELRLFVPLVIGAAAFVIVYGVVLNVPYNYVWYYAPVILTLSATGGLLVDEAARRIPRVPAAAVAVAAAAIVVVGVHYPLQLGYRSQYIPAAQWLSSHTSPAQTVAASEIGIIGWYSNRPMIDYLGLLSAKAADEFAARHTLWWLSNYQPDYWVMVEKPGTSAPLYQFDLPIVEQPWFAATFRPVFRNSVVVVYQRVAPVPATDS